MYSTDVLASIYKRNYSAIHNYLRDVTNEESRKHPPVNGNNINWVVGHIIASRNYIMPALKQAAFWSEEIAAPYMWGSEKLAEDKGLSLAELVDQFEASQNLLSSSLESLTNADLNSELEKGTVGQRLEFFAWHEGYHTGQLALLRRIIGKEV